MKLYLIVTCVLFAAITAAHACRIVAEGPRLAKEPMFVLLTLLAAAMTAWAGWLLGRATRRK